jgi:hypothetical protein
MKLCIFCSANNGLNPDFTDMTRKLALWAAENGHGIVFGGHDAGLMHTVSKTAKEAGGLVIGVVPRRIEEMGRLSPWLDVHIPCEDLTDRKQLMMDQSDAFIILPGGIGTLDELFTVASMKTLHFHQKPILLWNMKGFWDALIACLDDLQQKGVTRKPWRSYITVVNTLNEAVKALTKNTDQTKS